MFKAKIIIMARRKKFDEETKVLGFRVPRSKEAICRSIIQRWINAKGWEKAEAKRRAKNNNRG